MILSTSLRRTFLSRSRFQNIRKLSSYPDHQVVGLPALSPTMESGTINEWLLEEGTSFDAGQPLCSIQTDKATIDFESTDEGVLAKILVSAGNEINVGDPICVTVEDEDHVAAFANFTVDGTADAPAPQAVTPEPVVEAAPVTTEPALTPVVAAAAATDSGNRVKISPLAKKLAAEKSIASSYFPSIHGSGPGGRIIAEDILSFQPTAAPAVSVAVSAAPQVAPAVALPPTDNIKNTVPHYYLTSNFNVSALLDLRTKLDDSISLNDLLLKCIAHAVKSVPSVNSMWGGDFTRQYENVNIDYLLPANQVVTVENAQSKSVSEISNVLNSDDAPSGGAALGTMSVLNLGLFGITSGAGVLRPNQSALLTIGTPKVKLIPSSAEDKAFEETTELAVTLSADHRTVDGAVGALYLQALKEVIEEPFRLFV